MSCLLFLRMSDRVKSHLLVLTFVSFVYLFQHFNMFVWRAHLQIYAVFFGSRFYFITKIVFFLSKTYLLSHGMVLMEKMHHFEYFTKNRT